MNLAVSPERLCRQASRAPYTEHLHHQALGLEARVMQIHQIRLKENELRVDDGESNGSNCHGGAF